MAYRHRETARYAFREIYERDELVATDVLDLVALRAEHLCLAHGTCRHFALLSNELGVRPVRWSSEDFIRVERYSQLSALEYRLLR